MTGSVTVTTSSGRGERTEALVRRAAGTVPFAYGAIVSALVAADHGGYWPIAWGWTTLVLAWVAIVALVLGDVRPGRLELAWVVGLIAVCGWIAASLLWTTSGTQTVLEVERTLAYVTLAIATAAVLTRREAITGLVSGVWAGTTLVCLYALATRLFPDRLGVTDTVAGYRLATPLGYWNGLGLVAATAALIAVGLLVEGRGVPTRILAGTSLPLLLPTLYFTFSRGAWIALGSAVLLVIALSPRRLSFVTALLLTALPCAIAVAFAYRARPLRISNASLAAAVQAGHTLSWRLGLATLGGAATAAVWVALSARVRAHATIRHAYSLILASAAAAAVIGMLVHYGGPSGAFSHARHSLEGGNPAAGPDLSRHLLTLSSPARIDQWHVAVSEWRGHPLFGTGAGTYAQYWMAAHSDRERVLDVHNLYLETLSELGLVGLVLFVAALAVPLAGAVQVRRMAIAPVAAGVYGAWLVHAIYDWDWELPGSTVPALLSAGALLAATRGATTGRRSRWLLFAAAVTSGVLGTLGLIGNRALVQSGDALRRGDTAAALSEARRARRFAPWSSQPWQQLAAVEQAQGERRAALAAYRRAVELDPRNWELWLALASLSRGAERTAAVARLAQLSPAAAAQFGRRGSS